MSWQFSRIAYLCILLVAGWPKLTIADVLRVATWNIYFLYDEIDDVDVFPANRIPREEADFRNLASVMAQVDADIWALQEVESIDALNRLTKHLPGRYTVAISSRRARSQKTAIVIRNRPDLEVRLLPDFTGLDLGGLRYGLVLQVKSKDLIFTLMIVHLKSGCFGPENETPNCNSWATRSEQLRLINGWLQEQLATDPVRKVMVLGDFNQRFVSGSQGWKLLTDGVPLAAVDADWRNDCWFYDWPEFPLIDHIVVSKSLLPHVVAGSFQQPDLETNHPDISDDERDRLMRVLSDHCPLAVDFRY